MLKLDPKTAPSIADFLTAAPWKHALLTTYALSLSYFESEILRPLLRAGCDDIWLVADAEGYRASLLERRSMRVGQEYRLIPAALPNGLLHAKTIYLCNQDEHLLIVGSGNVTFGGHGRNAEVFEALSPDGAAKAFEDFAGFLEFFGTRPDIRLGRREWIDDFAVRARRAAARGVSSSPPIRLIHSLDNPVIAQLPEQIGGLGPCERALVMSPYHDPDGEAVEALLDTLDAAKGAVSVWPGKSTPFPFARTPGWGRYVEAITLAEPEKRFVHAKWYEFEFSDQRALLTGSINATRKALTTTDNVEIGVLRLMPLVQLPTIWKEASEPAFEPASRLPSGLGAREIVYADFDRADAQRLNGQMISGREMAGAWQVRLVQADGESYSGSATLDEEGRFAVHDPAFELFSTLAAVQVLLIRGDREARGWVHNDMLLSVGSRRRLTAGALSRLMRREGTDDDVQALLDYLSINAEQHLRLFDQPVCATDRGETAGDDERTVSVHIDELAPLDDNPAMLTVDQSAGGHPDDQFEKAMLRLRRVLLGHGRVRSEAKENCGEETIEEDLTQGGKRTPEEERRAIGLDDFETSISALIEEAHDRPEVVDRLLVLLVEVSMWMRLSRLGDPDGAHDFLSSWFFKASRIGHYVPDRITALQQHVITAAATLYALAPMGELQRTLGTSLHDSLEKFYRGAVDFENALARLLPDMQAGFSGLLFGDSDPIDLQSALREILAIRTRRQQLDDALKLAAEGKEAPRDWEIFSSDIGQALWQTFLRPDWQKRIKRAYPGISACAFQNLAFPPSETRQLRGLRFTRCVYCGRFTVDTNP